MDKKVGKAKINKKKKETELYEAAYELFTTKGTKNTAIDDIVKKAGVAKGTFYLYFKDKYDIINKLILKKTSAICKEAVDEVEKANLDTLEDRFIFFLEYLISYFKKNKLILKLINKNLSVVVIKRALNTQEEYSGMNEAVLFFINSLVERGMTKEEALNNLFFIFELVGGVFYTTIILEQPKKIDEVKNQLYKKVLTFLQVNR